MHFRNFDPTQPVSIYGVSILRERGNLKVESYSINLHLHTYDSPGDSNNQRFRFC